MYVCMYVQINVHTRVYLCLIGIRYKECRSAAQITVHLEETWAELRVTGCFM
jgi:hypothetical protein